MTFKQLYLGIKSHLEKCVKGESVVFTHRCFFGYEFHIKAVAKSDEESK